MCGIVGYIGRREAQPVLLNTLKRLEYRGYDSCGIALRGSPIQVHKNAGRVWELERGVPQNTAHAGIGHTRWATHGRVCPENAHPHLDCTGRIAVVHNGIIDNFQQLRSQLTAEGHSFCSETDTEVIPHLIEKYYQGDLERAVARALLEIEGCYALIVLSINSDKLVVARNGNPLIIGVGKEENLVASDIPALLDYTKWVIYLEDGDIGVITADGITIRNKGREVAREKRRISWTVGEVKKEGYEHFLLKEIHEQPRVIEDVLKVYLSAGEPSIDLGITIETEIENILLLACGTSYHAALVGEYIIEKLARAPVRAKLASEFNHCDTILGKTWAIGISQSGETADTLKALRKTKGLGRRTLAITNVAESSITRIADQNLYIKAGPEISVAATKSFTAQLTVLYLLALSYRSDDAKTRLIQELRLLPDKVQQILDQEEQIAQWGKYLAHFDNVFFIARGINFPIALEGALKMKEISYIHAEGYPAGELKHGPFALLNSNTPVIAILSQDSNYEALLTNIQEVEARETVVIGLAEEDDQEIEKYVDNVICVPKVDVMLSPVLNAVVLQLLAYYAAKERGCPIDMPRNLAKSVTVV